MMTIYGSGGQPVIIVLKPCSLLLIRMMPFALVPLFIENLETWMSHGVQRRSGKSCGESKKSGKSVGICVIRKFILSWQFCLLFDVQVDQVRKIQGIFFLAKLGNLFCLESGNLILR